MPNLTNLACLRGRVIDALRFAEEGSLDNNAVDLIRENLNEALRLLSAVEDEAAAELPPNVLPFHLAKGVH